MTNTMHKPIGDQIDENRKLRKMQLEKQLDDIEEWLLDNSFTHPDFEKKVLERNRINTLLSIK